MHDLLTSVYPSLTRYSGNGLAIEDCPWSDGPLINNFASHSAISGLSRSKEQSNVTALIVAASQAMGLTVLDEQTEEIHRPHVFGPEKTFDLVIHGIERNRDQDKVMADVGRTFAVAQDRLRSIFGGRPVKVRHGLNYLAALRYHYTLRKLGCRNDIVPQQRLAE